MSELPFPTRDPFGRGSLFVTRLESPTTGVTVEGRFSLGWVGHLTREQLDFVGLLLLRRNNLQQLADDLGVAYNTARSRLDDIVAAVSAGQPVTPPLPTPPKMAQSADPAVRELLQKLAAGEVSVDEADDAIGRP